MDQIIYYERYVVIQSGSANELPEVELNKMDFLTEEEYLDILEALPKENQYLDDRILINLLQRWGAEAIHDLLQSLNLEEMSYQLRDLAENETSVQRKNEALKRLQVVEAMKDSQTRVENRPEWMIVKVVPVIPPELRPLVPLDGGRFATSDLNDLYRRVL